MKSLFELINENINGCTFISVDTETSVATIAYDKHGRRNPHHNKVTKQMIGANVMIAQYKTTNAYENMVNKRLEKEGKKPNFKSTHLPWGERIPNTPFIQHGNKIYLQVIFLHAGSQVFMVDGAPFPKEKVQGIKVPHASRPLQNRLEDKVIVRVFDIKSINKVVINGKVLIKGVDFHDRYTR